MEKNVLNSGLERNPSNAPLRNPTRLEEHSGLDSRCSGTTHKTSNDWKPEAERHLACNLLRMFPASLYPSCTACIRLAGSLANG